MSKALLEPILEGIRSTYFFNGRLLSGEDLARDQSANRDAHRRIGRAIGEGVAFGLEVEKAAVSSFEKPVVTVKGGVAINRQGDVIELPGDTELSLIGAGTQTAAVPSAFTECEPPAGAGFRVGDGTYLLVMWPAEGREGRAPVSGLGNATASCNARCTVEGVRFRVLQIGLTQSELTQTEQDDSRLRNQIAYRCFGTEAATEFFGDPFGPAVTKYSAIDQLRRDGKMTDCDVPLAVIFWTSTGGIEFVDMWAARRRLTAPPVSDPWGLLAGDRRASEVEAMFLQFEDQIEEMLVNERDPGAIEAKARFAFLPPAGLLPCDLSPLARTFQPLTFFGLESPPLVISGISGSQLRSLFREAISHEPIDLGSTDAIQLYLVWDNLIAIERKQTTRVTVVFARSGLGPTGQDLPWQFGQSVSGLFR